MGQTSSGENTAGLAVREISVLRHELLNVLLGLTGMARLLHGSGLTAEQREWIEAMDRSVEQAAYLVHAAASWERCGVAERRPPPEFNGIRLLEQVVLAHTPAAQSKGLSLRLSCSPGLPARWRGELGLLRQLLDNLLGNAVKFTDHGEVAVSARVGREGSILLAVRDTGPGVRPTELKRIFEARERGSSGQGKPGSGLGLWLSRRIVERMGGEISCHPAPDGGAEFRVSLPRLAFLEGGIYPR